jgi:hypothetical protein
MVSIPPGAQRGGTVFGQPFIGLRAGDHEGSPGPPM